MKCSIKIIVVLVGLLALSRQQLVIAVDTAATVGTLAAPYLAPYVVGGTSAGNVATGVFSGYEKFGKRTRPGLVDAALLGGRLAHQAYKAYSGEPVDTTALAGLVGETVVAGHMLSKTRTRSLEALKENPLAEIQGLLFSYARMHEILSNPQTPPNEKGQIREQLEVEGPALIKELRSKGTLTYIRDIIGEENLALWKEIQKTTQARYNIWQGTGLLPLPPLDFENEDLSLLGIPTVAFTLLVDIALEKVSSLEGVQKYIRSGWDVLTAPTRFSINTLQKFFSSGAGQENGEGKNQSTSPQVTATPIQKIQMQALALARQKALEGQKKSEPINAVGIATSPLPITPKTPKAMPRRTTQRTPPRGRGSQERRASKWDRTR